MLGCNTRTLLTLVRTQWEGHLPEPPIPVLDLVDKLQNGMRDSLALAHVNLKAAQEKLKCWYDKSARDRSTLEISAGS